MGKDSNGTQLKMKDFVPETIAAIMGSKTMNEAAGKLSIDPSTLYDRINNYPQIKETVAKMREMAIMNLNRVSVRASEVLGEGLEESGPIRYEVAKDILNAIDIPSKNSGVALQVNSIGGEMGIVVKEFKDND